MTELKTTFKTDILFKSLFVKYPLLLRRLVAHLLKIPFKKISQFEIRNPEMPPESIGKKFCRLDINMTVDGQNVNLEVQVEDEGDYPERTLFYWARMYSNALPVSGKYIELPRTIMINILNFNLFRQRTGYHSEYQALEVTHHHPLTNKFTLHFFELPKLPKEIDNNDLLLLWLSLFNANTKEELDRIDRLGVPELSEAVSAYNTVTSSPEYQELERLRIKASHDEAQALYNAEKRGEQRGEQRGAANERKKWQGVVDDKNAEIEKLKKEIKK